MSAPVWVLSVDLQTKTATFQSGMAEAARSARGAFTDIGGGAKGMADTVGRTSGEARHSVMMLGEEFGVHLPRGITSFITSIGPVGAAMEAAFPFLAIILGATLLVEHLNKVHEAGQKLTEDQNKFKLAAANAFNSLEDKLLEAEKKTDELRGDHIGALAKELVLIDHQSMGDLMKEFDLLGAQTEKVLAGIKASWYEFGAGSAGAKASLEEFSNEYKKLLTDHNEAGASDLLQKKLQRELEVLREMQFVQGNTPTATTGGAWKPDAKTTEYYKDINNLASIHAHLSDADTKSQAELVKLLQEQSQATQAIAQTQAVNKTNAGLRAGKAEGKDAAAEARKQLELEKKASEEAKRFYEEAYRSYVQSIDEGERNTIAATKEGSSARLAAITAAIKEEETEHLQSTGYYRELLTQRVNLVRQMGEEEDRLKAEAAKESANQEARMGELALAAEKEHSTLMDSARRVSAQQQLDEAIHFADAEYDIKKTELLKEIAALDETSKEYDNKLQAILNRETQLTQHHADEITSIKEKAAKKQDDAEKAALSHLVDITSTALTQVLMGHESFAKAMDSVGNQVATGMMQNALKSMMTLDMTKEKDAAAGARKAFNIGLGIGGPAGMILGPLFGATTFAAMMAFEKGGIVPGIGRGDIVPAMLEPGEGVLPKQVMERLNSGASTGPTSTFHVTAHYAPTISAVDATGVESLLAAHGDKFQAHFENTLRKMNR